MGLQSDSYYMRRALAVARRGAGLASPNPMVGACLVKDRKIISYGYHAKFGAEHAEVMALKSARKCAQGATLYVTLEPCNHQGKTPPCTEAILAAGISRVVCAMRDPNTQVLGRGVERLEQAGIEVKLGVLEAEARRLNEFWCYHQATGLPFVILKVALSADAKVGLRGEGKTPISGTVSMRHLHGIRSRVDAILVGGSTVIADDPLLSNRRLGAKHMEWQPKRVVLQGSQLIDRQRQIFNTPNLGEVIVYSEKDHTHLDLRAVLKDLGARGMTSVLVEAGPKLFDAVFNAQLFQRLLVYSSPKILGPDGINLGCRVEEIQRNQEFKSDSRRLGADSLIRVERK
ncbi:bifunctional diaminohydroxyphosphoribosylaminopyrimidine deaminase/5-amino-6-(5-phosphoribosylamino)uracil reductase RibD [bacterium]|nr:bifunctional diaminohydroxyphosphoribosylaminopyrimidine deaminase/5-amino-6-(5-phosphoribosylamino)uracil reductase RibD [bacterium]